MRVRFGVHFEPLWGFDYKTIERVTLNAEKIGYDSVWTSDHFFLDEDSANISCMEAWTLLSALAARTSKLRLGVLVSCNSYRHPGLLAKMSATVDVISNGRLIFGIGAGWKESEYRAYGYRFPSNTERLAQLEEAVQLTRMLWTQDRTTFQGRHYQLRDAVAMPKPVQKPYPPILIGGMGEKVTLKLVAKYGDMCNFSPWGAERLDALLEALRTHCVKIGRDYDLIEKTFLGYALLTDKDEDVRRFNIERGRQQGKTLDQYMDQQAHLPGAWAGPPEVVAEQYQYLVDMGFTHFQVMFEYGKDYEQSSEFAKSVIPKVR